MPGYGYDEQDPWRSDDVIDRTQPADQSGNVPDLATSGGSFNVFGGGAAEVQAPAPSTSYANDVRGDLSIGAPSGAASASSAPQTAAAGATRAYQDQLQRIRSMVDPTQQAIAKDELARNVAKNLTDAGHDVKWQGDQLMVDGRPYVIGDGSGGSGGGGGSITGNLDYQMTAPAYAPGEITFDDIPNLGYDQMLADATKQTPIETQADALISEILGDPYGGLDDRFLDTLKARSKDSMAAAYRDDERAISDLTHGLGMEIESPWAASEKLKAAQGYKLGLAGINRETELDVTEKRAALKREAGMIGANYASGKAQHRLAAMTLASDTAFRRSAAIGDRMALRESVNQAAAQLGISRDQVMSGFILQKAGLQLQEKQLQQQDAQWREELFYKLATLDEQSRMFDLDFEAQRDDEAWDRANP